MKSGENKIGGKFRTPVYGVPNSSSLPVISRRFKIKVLFVLRFFPEVSDENSLKEQLQLSSIVCAKQKTTFNTRVCFHVSVTADDFPLIHSTGVWRDGCLIAPLYGRLSPDPIFNSVSHVMYRPLSPGATGSLAAPTSGSVAVTHETHGGGATPHTRPCRGSGG